MTGGDASPIDVLALLQSHWAWALGLAAVFYGTTRFLGGHLSADWRTALAGWLKGEIKEDHWARHFCAFFDQVFGKRHLTWQCFRRSSVASLTAVIALYLLFGEVFGLLDVRTADGLALGQVLLIGAAVNIVPDYLSLLETRWVLRQMQRVRSVAGQAAVLAADLVFTAAIIAGAIALFRLAIGAPALSAVEMLAFFSAYALFFYSSFLTSVWSWLYCLSTLLLRLFTRTPLRHGLDVETKPVAQVALVGGGLVLMASLALAPLVAPDPTDHPDRPVSRFDDWLCRSFPADACPHVARLTADEEAQLAYIERACEGRAFDFCYDEANRRLGIDDAATASLASRACDSGDARSCSGLGWLYAEGVGVGQDDAQAIVLYRQGCDGGDAAGCTGLGWMHEWGRGVGQDDTKAVTLYRQGCDGGDVFGCTNLGTMHNAGRGVEQDQAQAAVLYRQGCDGGAARGCTNLGTMYDAGRGVEQDQAQAAVLYRQGCDGGNALGCANLAWMYESGHGVGLDDAMAANLYRRACNGGLPRGCTGLARMYEFGRGVEQDDSAAVAFYGRACDFGDALGCMILARIYEFGLGVEQDDAAAVGFYRQGCEHGDRVSCRALTRLTP